MIYLILLLGLILRLISINQSFWLDEATSGNVVRSFSYGDIVTKFSVGDFHPPLYYLLLKFWASIFGSNDWVLRIPSVTFGILTIFIVYKIGYSLKNKRVGIIVALLLATSSLHVYYSQEARMYSLATLLVSLSFYSFIKALESKQKRWQYFFILSLLGSIYTDYVPVLILPVYLYLIFKKRLSGIFFPAFFIFILGIIFLLPLFYTQVTSALSIGKEGNAWLELLGFSNFKNIFLIAVKFIFGRVSLDNKIIYGLVSLFLVIIYWGLSLKSVFDKKVRLLMFWLLLPILAAIAVSFFVPILSYFRLLFVLPAFYLLIAYSLDKLPEKYFVPLLSVLVIVNITSTMSYLTQEHFQRENWKGAVEFIKNDVGGKDYTLLFPANSQMEAVKYYWPDSHIIYGQNFSDKSKKVYLFRYVWEIFDPNDSTRINLENLGYKRTSEHNFNSVVVWVY